VGLSDGIAVQQAQRAMAVFSFFLFVVYGFFGLILAIFRNDVVKEGKRDLPFRVSSPNQLHYKPFGCNLSTRNPIVFHIALRNFPWRRRNTLCGQ
jgi:hypothetical protein